MILCVLIAYAESMVKIVGDEGASQDLRLLQIAKDIDDEDAARVVSVMSSCHHVI